MRALMGAVLLLALIFTSMPAVPSVTADPLIDNLHWCPISVEFPVFRVCVYNDDIPQELCAAITHGQNVREFCVGNPDWPPTLP